jgi:UrcA family protein
MNTHIRTLTALAMLAGSTMGAMASDPWPGTLRIETLSVRYDDLDISKPQGVAALHFRMRVAANSVCVPETSGAQGERMRRQCRKQAIEQALPSAPPALRIHHAAWKAQGSKWLAKPEPEEISRMAATR